MSKRFSSSNPLAQSGAVIVAKFACAQALALASGWGLWRWADVPFGPALLGLVALAAGLVARGVGLLHWWALMAAGFLPLLVVALSLAWPAWVWALAFGLTFLVYGQTYKNRVPLYLSNVSTAAALLALLPKRPCKVLDLGCAHAGLLRHLAVQRPDCHFAGVEHAPATAVLARLLSLSHQNVSVRWGNLWAQPLQGVDVVYVFLSPAPMARLWAKAQAEMGEGACLISNSFPVPDVKPSHVLRVGDMRNSVLYVYRIKTDHGPDAANVAG